MIEEKQYSELCFFKLFDTTCAIPTEAMVEITNKIRYTVVAGTEPWIEGVANLRGHLVTCIDVPLKLKNHSQDLELNKYIIVRMEDGDSIGLHVEDVLNVVTVQPRLFYPPPQQNFFGLDKQYFPLCYKESGVLTPILSLAALLRIPSQVKA